MMAFSSNPGVRDLQNGVGFAFRPIQGALDSVAGGIASVGDRDHRDRPAADRQRASSATRTSDWPTENTQVDEIQRENELLTGLLQLQAGFDYKTAAAAVIGRESLELRRRRDDRQGDQRRPSRSATS